ncbi:MAG TPA: response regulator [Polyangia bacterium]|nr:response regulator [Polyangia bacterium]
MVDEASRRRVLLRAEVVAQGKRQVSHTLEMSDSAALVQADHPPALGQPVRLQVSFPRLLAPFELEGLVTGHHPARKPGDVAAMTVEFVFRSDDERRKLAALLARISTVPTPPEELPPDQAAPSYRVLLVEDNHMIQDIFAYGVRKYFHRQRSSVTVDVAADGQQAWQMLLEVPYDLAIVDFYLPVLDGSKLVGRMRGEPRLAGLPVVAISVGGTTARDAMLEAGADLYLDKPIVLRDLFSTLERLTSGGREP